MKPILLTACLVAAAFALAACAAPKSTSSSLSAGFWKLEETPLDRSAAQFDVTTATHLYWADQYRDRIVQATGPRTIENTLVPYNLMMMRLEAAAAECELFFLVHPNEDVREVARKGQQAVSEKVTALSLNRDLYDAVRAVDAGQADPETRFFVEKLLRDFRRAGVDKDEAVREKVKALNAEIVDLGQQFRGTIAGDTRSVKFGSAADLAGLPQDWIAGHEPGADGKIAVTTQYPDYMPYMSYAASGANRLMLYREFMDRGYPQNVDVLNTLLAKRHELATLLGYANWADYITEDKMIGSEANVQDFLDRLASSAAPFVQRDVAVLLERKKRDDPAAIQVEDWERSFYERLVKEEQYGFDPQQARQYFDFKRVQQGLFDLTGKMFGVEYRQVHGLNLWHPEVTAWDLFQGKKHVGRFYLDLHPRENKYNHAACFGYRAGVEGERLPQAVLVCNFPNPNSSPDGKALMEHGDVVTFFHEFGHLLHSLFGGHVRWVNNSGVATEWDFVEAPSQMLEEWCWDVETLQVFAKHHETGEPIPPDLVNKMKAASDFGKGLWTARQVFLAAVSLNYHNRDPKTFDATRLMVDLQAKYSPWPYVEGTHFQYSFGHLENYSAIYYTYLWSKVISKDLFTVFQQKGLMNTKYTKAYRAKVLDPGGSKKAADLVSDFLGRPFSFEAFEEWLARG